MLTFIENISNSAFAHMILRIFLACMFGALIGMEREHSHRPAGFRTHILVCVGACLVMLTSEHVYSVYRVFSPNIDVARLGAQVISGIGFLGAGTIIRNGSSVKGLTTAASIWAVGCIGLATGIGYYSGATVATLIIFLVLTYFKSIAKSVSEKQSKETFIIKCKFSDKLLSSIKEKFNSYFITINNVSIKSDNNDITEMNFSLSLNASTDSITVVNEIYGLPEVLEVTRTIPLRIKSKRKSDEI